MQSIFNTMSSTKSNKKVKSKKSNSTATSPLRAMPSRKAIAHMRQLLEYVPPARLKKNLLYVFLIFLEHEHDMLPINFREMASDYYMLFQFLDKMEEEK